MRSAVIYACSHRKGGNSDRAAELLARGIREAGGKSDTIRIREYQIRHCLACGHCDKAIDLQGCERCVLGKTDDAWTLFKPLFTARTVFFASPIYFYHLPSMLKTWIDRSQQFWTARKTGENWIADLPERQAHAGKGSSRGQTSPSNTFCTTSTSLLPTPLSSGELTGRTTFPDNRTLNHG